MSRRAPGITPAWTGLRILSFCRLLLAGLLTMLFFGLREADPFGVVRPALFTATLLAWLAFSVAAGFGARLRRPAYLPQVLGDTAADIIAIALLMHASGGAGSSLSVLLVAAVGAGALLLPGRYAYGFAALATLAVLAETSLARLTGLTVEADSLTRAGLLGLVLFAAAGLAHALARRLRETEALAAQRGVDLANLEQLNRHIIRTLDEGVLILDPDDRVRLANQAAARLLGASPAGRRLNEVSAPLAGQLAHWRRDPGWTPQVVPGAEGRNLLPRFVALRTAQGRGALVFLEDSTRAEARHQQTRLASLGRLTASIAHEIRNPLGAISHAAQLLNESPQLAAQDARLADIIQHHSRRLNAVIENVLQLSRRAPAERRTLALRPWLEQFARELREAGGADGPRLRLDVQPPDLEVRIDPDHLHQVLQALCQNALRHAGENAAPAIEARALEGGAACLDVLDEGPGIDPQTAARIFEPFFTTAGDGTGLGLYVARELCLLNGCQLEYRPRPGGGSCFRIHFGAG